MKFKFILVFVFFLCAFAVNAQPPETTSESKWYAEITGIQVTNYVNIDDLSDRPGFDVSFAATIGFNDNFSETDNAGFDVRARYEIVLLNPDHYEFNDTDHINAFAGITTSITYDVLNVAQFRGGVDMYMNTYLNAPSVDIVASVDVYAWKGLTLNVGTGRHLSRRIEIDKPNRGLYPSPMASANTFFVSTSISYRFGFGRKPKTPKSI